MLYGWVGYELGGEPFYILACGNGALSYISLDDTSPPEFDNDPGMKRIAESAKRWILEGKECKVDLDIELTPFQEKVLSATSMVPRGYVSTYSDIARAIGCTCSQAVGQALRRNPVPLFIPCHRIVMKGGSFDGFRGNALLKRHVLEMEGVTMHDGRIDPSQILHDL
ncbi:MAG TPA: MGMT family protein [Candidatus Methanofastidiosa archaeon]|nr:MGMT family protein [Candidatus Methanofastidiosa archaeon]